MGHPVGSVVYESKLARYEARVDAERAAEAKPTRRRKRAPQSAVNDPVRLARQRAQMHLLRRRVEFWTGLLPDEWSALPAGIRRTIVRAIRQYYEEIAEPRSPHGGMYGLIADTYGGLPWVDWAHDGRGVIDDGY